MLVLRGACKVSRHVCWRCRPATAKRYAFLAGISVFRPCSSHIEVSMHFTFMLDTGFLGEPHERGQMLNASRSLLPGMNLASADSAMYSLARSLPCVGSAILEALPDAPSEGGVIAERCAGFRGHFPSMALSTCNSACGVVDAVAGAYTRAFAGIPRLGLLGIIGSRLVARCARNRSRRARRQLQGPCVCRSPGRWEACASVVQVFGAHVARLFKGAMACHRRVGV